MYSHHCDTCNLIIYIIQDLREIGGLIHHVFLLLNPVQYTAVARPKQHWLVRCYSRATYNRTCTSLTLCFPFYLKSSSS